MAKTAGRIPQVDAYIAKAAPFAQPILRHLREVHEVDTTLVVQTALIALCNKVITANLADMPWTELVAVAALIGALAAAILALRPTPA